MPAQSATRNYTVVQVDVFTDHIFGGNPLAVVLDAVGLSDVEMQSIAREMNLSETTFVLPATRSECAVRVRIFTPETELPFAGHPTLGTAWVLATRGLLPHGTMSLRLEEGVGPVSVDFDGDSAAPRMVWMHHRSPNFEPVDAPTTVAIVSALGLRDGDLLPGAPLQRGSTGVPFLYVPLVDLETVDRAEPDMTHLRSVLADNSILGVIVVASAGLPDHIYSRMFAPGSAGIPEDPATGSAAGPLAEYVIRHRLVTPGPGLRRLVDEQGTRMGRQSLLHLECTVDPDGTVRDIRVGGSVVRVLEASLSLPPPAP